MRIKNKIIASIIVLSIAFSTVFVTVQSSAQGNTVYGLVDYAPVYDYEYYSDNYPDLRLAFGDNEEMYLKHFVAFGMKEGRRANETFDVISYMNYNPDLRRAFGNNKEIYYIHYINYGRFEKRETKDVNVLIGAQTVYEGMDLSSIYDYQFYVNRYPDLKKTFAGDDKGAISHFVNWGIKEGRIAKENYNPSVYRKLQIISANASGAPTAYCGIDLSGIYDYFYYVWNNPDVATTFNYDPLLTIKHFGDWGIKEGRRAKYQYDKNAYDSLKEQVKNIPLPLLNMANKINQYSSPTSYAIAVDKTTKQVGVFTGQKGSYSLVKQFPCATGAMRSPTPNGVYNMGARGLYFNTGTRGRCWYYTQIRGNYLFHSQIYDRQNRPVNIIDGAMGAAVSHGCIRLYLNDAKWLYDNMPSGTTIVIY